MEWVTYGKVYAIESEFETTDSMVWKHAKNSEIVYIQEEFRFWDDDKDDSTTTSMDKISSVFNKRVVFVP